MSHNNESYPEIGFFTYEELTSELEGLVQQYPDLAKLESLGKTPEGREIWLLTLGGDFDRLRPAIWLDGNMHAAELAGTSVCVAYARSMLRKMKVWQTSPPREYMERIHNEILHYICPRISPDGAEAFIQRNQLVRSAPRDESVPPTRTPRWEFGDVDGDGLITFMRQEHPDGEYVEHPGRKGLMHLRTIQDAGPYYRLYREGTIENFDGHTIPGIWSSTRNHIDLNRNFPFNWDAAHNQDGAGDYPGSEPESKALIDFAIKHPNIFAWLNYHCFGGVYIRPLGHKPDSKMDQWDIEIYKMLGEWTEELSGYRMVSGYEEFLYEPDKPLLGDLSEWAYEHRGAVAMVCEIWDLFKRLDVEKKPMILSYESFTSEVCEKFYDWDQKENQGRSFVDWKAFDHPQLGEIEIGGMDTRFGLWNPPPEELPKIAVQQVQFLERLASLAPSLEIEVASRKEKTDDLVEVETVVRNTGYLPTSILASAKKLSINEEIVVTLELSKDLRLESGDITQHVGDLAGWGRGKSAWSNLSAFAGSEANTYEKQCRWVFGGTGQARITAGNRRVGFVHCTLEF